MRVTKKVVTDVSRNRKMRRFPIQGGVSRSQITTIIDGDVFPIDLADAAQVTGLLAAANMAGNSRLRGITFGADNHGSVLTTGRQKIGPSPYSGTIVAIELVLDQSGSIVVDIWRDTGANYPPTVADTIFSSGKPTISSALRVRDTTLTGVSLTITEGDEIAWNIDSVTAATWVTGLITVRVS